MLEIVCPAAVTDVRFPVPHWYAFFSKLFLLWVVGGATLVAGVVLAIRDRRRSRPPPSRQAIAGPALAEEAEPATFGRKPIMVLSPSAYKPSPERQALLALETGVREAAARGDLDGALALVDRAIRDCNDDRLTAAASSSRSADFDWVTIVAAAVEADVVAKAVGEEGCQDVLLELGSVDEDRTLLYRSFFGPRPPQEVAWLLKHGQTLREHGPVRQTIAIVGIDHLAVLEASKGWTSENTGRAIVVAEVERRHLVSSLAGTMLVLRYLDIVRRHAAATGFPFPVTLRAGVASIGGEDAIRQRDPRLGLDPPCRVAPIGDEVVARLEERFARHIASYREDCAESLRNFHNIFVTKGRVESRFIPRSMPEFEHYRELEMRLAVFEPENRVSMSEFNALLALMEAVMESEGAKPIDPSPYR